MAAPALAQGDTDEESALALNRSSRALYDQGRYAEAAALLREAYRLKPVPILQYNLARACERMEDYACAIAAYESFLPHALFDERSRIQERLALDRKRLAEARKPAAPVPRPRSHSIAPPIVTAIGVVGLGVAGGLYYEAVHRNDAAFQDLTPDAKVTKERAEALQRAAIGTSISSGLVVAAGVAWWIYDRRAPRRAPTSAQLHIGPGTITVVAAF